QCFLKIDHFVSMTLYFS
ncbi:hypothetical protein D046_0078B, partial [Vibrio parahaemolyticus V-223/04]